MGRFLLFIIVIAAALAGVWFYAPGGKDMLLGAKDKAMSHMPAKADDAADATSDAMGDATVEPMDEIVAEEVIVDEVVVVDEVMAEDAAADDSAPN